MRPRRERLRRVHRRGDRADGQRHRDEDAGVHGHVDPRRLREIVEVDQGPGDHRGSQATDCEHDPTRNPVDPRPCRTHEEHQRAREPDTGPRSAPRPVERVREQPHEGDRSDGGHPDGLLPRASGAERQDDPGDRRGERHERERVGTLLADELLLSRVVIRGDVDLGRGLHAAHRGVAVARHREERQREEGQRGHRQDAGGGVAAVLRCCRLRCSGFRCSACPSDPPLEAVIRIVG